MTSAWLRGRLASCWWGRVGAAGGGGVVAVACGGGARVEVGCAGEGLADDARADELAVLLMSWPLALSCEEDLRDAGDDERIDDAEDDGA